MEKSNHRESRALPDKTHQICVPTPATLVLVCVRAFDQGPGEREREKKSRASLFNPQFLHSFFFRWALSISSLSYPNSSCNCTSDLVRWNLNTMKGRERKKKVTTRKNYRLRVLNWIQFDAALLNYFPRHFFCCFSFSDTMKIVNQPCDSHQININKLLSEALSFWNINLNDYCRRLRIGLP